MAAHCSATHQVLTERAKPMIYKSPVNRILMGFWVKPILMVLLSLPLAWLIWAVFNDQLGANPAEALIRSLGDWTLRALVLVLAMTPLRVALGLTALARLRRMVGLAVYFYASLHLSAYAWFDMGFVWGRIVDDVIKRPFILVGMLSWAVLTLLALTSFNRAIRWLGARRWKGLHRLVYAVACLAMLHFFWVRAGKNNFAEVVVYAAVFGVLLGLRVWRRWAPNSPIHSGSLLKR